LAQILSLNYIDLVGISLTDAGLAKLVHLPRLRRLFLTNTRVTEEGVTLLATLEHLEELGLMNTPVTIRGLRALRNLPLSRLQLSGSQVKYSDLPEVVALFPGLQTFDGRGLQGDIGAGLSPLAEFPKLEILCLAAGQVTAGAPHHLQRFPRLQELEISSGEFPVGLAAELSQLPRVTTLRLKNPKFNDTAFGELCANKTLEYLKLFTWPGRDSTGIP
jgi:internalin A